MQLGRSFDVSRLKGKPSIPDETIEAIRDAIEKGDRPQWKIAKEFGVSQKTVSAIKRNVHRVKT